MIVSQVYCFKILKNVLIMLIILMRYRGNCRWSPLDRSCSSLHRVNESTNLYEFAVIKKYVSCTAFLLYILHFNCSRVQNIFWEKIGNQEKLCKIRKRWYLLLRNFWVLVLKFHFCRVLSSSSLKLFGNCWDNEYFKFYIRDIKFHFTCGKSNLY